MRRGRAVGIGCGLALVAHAPLAASGVPESGRYEVEVRLELPHVESAAARKTVRVCLAGGPVVGDHGLAVLSDNNPLATCPASNVRQDGDELTFDIACAGRNAGWATARFLLAPTGFRGRIAMWLGGKNMTMAEVQAGRRIGDCRGPGAESAPEP